MSDSWLQAPWAGEKLRCIRAQCIQQTHRQDVFCAHQPCLSTAVRCRSPVPALSRLTACQSDLNLMVMNPPSIFKVTPKSSWK